MNLARIKALSMMVCALCKVQRVTYTKLAAAFDSNAASGSSLRRIQRLIAQCEISTDFIAKLILKLIPVAGPYNLTMDRTNWKFSDTNINILTFGIIYDGMAFPIVFKMMDKRGNSNTRERMELVNRFIRLAGENSINHLMADCEFVGSEWLGYLNARGIHFHIRICDNFHVIRHGQESRAYWLFNDLRVGESKHLDGIYYVNGQACYLCLKSRTRTENRCYRSLSRTVMQRKLSRCTNSGGKWRRCSGHEIERLRYRRFPCP